MDKSEIMVALQSVFNEVFLEEVVVSADLTAADVAEWDSLVNVSIMFAIESQFGIRFGVGSFESAKNVGELVDVIRTGLIKKRDNA